MDPHKHFKMKNTIQNAWFIIPPRIQQHPFITLHRLLAYTQIHNGQNARVECVLAFGPFRARCYKINYP